jgi:hypothetical protein
MPVRTGNRQILVWGVAVWVTLLPTEVEDEYRVLSPDGVEFAVTAASDLECITKIAEELRKRYPRAS